MRNGQLECLADVNLIPVGRPAWGSEVEFSDGVFQVKADFEVFITLSP